ncbi:MAG: ABC transporter permease [Pelolinea sp.]|nr:ABC transporter permease [Pelolinea sp.]
MNELLIGFAGVIAAATPVVVAVIGETFTERAGVINLSANGIILLSAMAGFAAASYTGNALIGLLAGAAVGALAGAVVSFCSITIKQSQVAVGFILALLFKDLSYFLGTPLMGTSGPAIGTTHVPILSNLPVLGDLFFKQSWLTYFSFILIIGGYLWIFHTRQGLMLRAVGEQPVSSFARGINVNRLRYIYTILGAALIGLAGPMYSLSVKAGWKGTLTGLDGIGWIVLSITIFGGWNPLRGALGAYLFVFLQWLGLVLQTTLPNIPSQVLQVAPFPLMIFTLLFVNIGDTEWVIRILAKIPRPLRLVLLKVIKFIKTPPPASLGSPFEKE